MTCNLCFGIHIMQMKFLTRKFGDRSRINYKPRFCGKTIKYPQISLYNDVIYLLFDLSVKIVITLWALVIWALVITVSSVIVKFIKTTEYT